MVGTGLMVEVEGVGTCSCLVTGEPSPTGRVLVENTSGVKTLLVMARPKALIEPKSGNVGVSGMTMGGGLNAGGVEPAAVVALWLSLRYRAIPLT